MRMRIKSIGNNNTFVRCCGDNGLMHYITNKYVKSCNPIIIPNDDAFYEPKLQSCMDYVRSVPAMRSDCTFGHIDQVTVILIIKYNTTILYTLINFYILFYNN